MAEIQRFMLPDEMKAVSPPCLRMLLKGKALLV